MWRHTISFIQTPYLFKNQEADINFQMPKRDRIKTKRAHHVLTPEKQNNFTSRILKNAYKKELHQ